MVNQSISVNAREELAWPRSPLVQRVSDTVARVSPASASQGV